MIWVSLGYYLGLMRPGSGFQWGSFWAVKARILSFLTSKASIWVLVRGQDLGSRAQNLGDRGQYRSLRCQNEFLLVLLYIDKHPFIPLLFPNKWCYNPGNRLELKIL